MDKKYIIEKLNSIQKEINKKDIDKGYLLEKIKQIETDIKQKGV